MIFVTVGTHEQAFNRLIQEIDLLKCNGKITEEVICQIGYSDYIPKYCKWEKMISYEEMINNVKEARIVITHGGPASFLLPLQYGKIPIVVPRQLKYNEHVNNHQLDFLNKIIKKMDSIILVEDVGLLESKISRYDSIISDKNKINSNNTRLFCDKFESIVTNVLKGR